MKLKRINEIRNKSLTGSNFLKQYHFQKFRNLRDLPISLAVASRDTSKERYRDDHSRSPGALTRSATRVG